MVKQTFEDSVDKSLEKLLEKADQMSRRLQAELAREVSRQRINPLTEEIEFQLTIEVKKVRKQ